MKRFIIIGSAAVLAALVAALVVNASEKMEPATPSESVGVGRVEDVDVKITYTYAEPEPVEEEGEAEAGPVLLVSEAGYTAYAHELEEVARLVWLEARGEPTNCQRNVCEVIFNRLASGIWGDTLTDVIYYDYAFEPAEFIDEAETTDEIREMVYDVFWNGSELPERIMFFRADYYHQWDGAVDEFSVGRTYFSSSEWCQ